MRKEASEKLSETADVKGEFLLELAAKVFLEKGFAGASVGEIARRAHASKETFYHRYESKEQLFEAVMQWLVNRFSVELDATTTPQDLPAKVLTAFGQKMMDRILSDEGIALQNIVHMESKRFPEIAKVFFELGPQRAIRLLGKYLESQATKKRLRPLDGETAAWHFMGILTFELLMRRSAGLVKKPLPVSKQHVKMAVDTFMRAYGPC